jgi:hypothetical protein
MKNKRIGELIVKENYDIEEVWDKDEIKQFIEDYAEDYGYVKEE